MTKRLGCVLIIPAVFILDRFFKFFILHRFSEGEGFPVWAGVFHITRVNNTGAAFGIFRGAGNVLIALSAVCLAILAVYFFRSLIQTDRRSAGAAGRTQEYAAWAMVLGGALGNLYDRLRYGYVIDFLDFRVWPVFNVADASICLGIFWVLLRLAKSRPGDL